MIKDNILKTEQTLEERGIPNNSFWSVIFEDGSELNEKETNWSLLSEKKMVKYFRKTKIVNVSKFEIKKIKINHDILKSEIEVPNDCQVYQAIRSETLITSQGDKKNRVLGRIMGLVKNDKVIEEIFLNGIELKVEGFRI